MFIIWFLMICNAQVCPTSNPRLRTWHCRLQLFHIKQIKIFNLMTIIEFIITSVNEIWNSSFINVNHYSQYIKYKKQFTQIQYQDNVLQQTKLKKNNFQKLVGSIRHIFSFKFHINPPNTFFKIIIYTMFNKEDFIHFCLKCGQHLVELGKKLNRTQRRIS